MFPESFFSQLALWGFACPYPSPNPVGCWGGTQRAGGIPTPGVQVSVTTPAAWLYPPVPLLTVLLPGRVTSGAPARCKDPVARRRPRQGHPQRVPWERRVPRHRRPPPRSPAGARGTDLCRLGDFCLLFCFVLRCPCNCLRNPDCIIFIADGAERLCPGLLRQVLFCSSDQAPWPGGPATCMAPLPSGPDAVPRCAIGCRSN